MKRIIIIVFLGVLFFQSCTNSEKVAVEKKPAPIPEPTLIKSCKIYSSEFAILDAEDKGRLIQEYKFNKKGFVNELVRYGMDGEVIAQFDIYGQDNPFPTPTHPVYTDTVLTVVNMSSDGEMSKKEVKRYNDDGLLIEATLYTPDGEMIQKNTYAYNEKKRISKDVYWDVSLNEPMQVVRYEYEYFLLK